MKPIDFPIERINEYLDNHVFEVEDESMFGFPLKTNVKVNLTGIKNYIVIGDSKPHITYTLYVLPSNKTSDIFFQHYSESRGGNIQYITTSSDDYYFLRKIIESELDNLLPYFGVDLRTICTKVVVMDMNSNLTEGLMVEGKLDGIVRQIVRDIITLYKNKKIGEYGLPEDLRPEELTYDFSSIPDPISIFLDLSQDDDIETFDLDADYYRDDDLIHVTILYNPEKHQQLTYELIGELNEVIMHELEHIKQYERGFEFPKKEPKKPEKYYTQQHELEALRKGFKRGSKVRKMDYETLVRNWFVKYKNKHNLNPKQIEFVVSKILSEK